MNQLKPLENGYESRTRKNVIQLFRWTVAWGGSCALVAFGPKFLWNKALVFTLLAIGLSVCVPFHADVAHLVALMGLTYGACNLYGTRRYQ